jgi:hypothetical protein
MRCGQPEEHHNPFEQEQFEMYINFGMSAFGIYLKPKTEKDNSVNEYRAKIKYHRYRQQFGYIMVFIIKKKAKK